MSKQLQTLKEEYEKDLIKLDREIHKFFMKGETIEEMLLTGKKVMLRDVVKDLERLLK